MEFWAGGAVEFWAAGAVEFWAVRVTEFWAVGATEFGAPWICVLWWVPAGVNNQQRVARGTEWMLGSSSWMVFISLLPFWVYLINCLIPLSLQNSSVVHFQAPELIFPQFYDFHVGFGSAQPALKCAGGWE